MSPILTLLMAFAAFNIGFIVGLMFVAMVRSHYEKDDCDLGAPEGDQTTRFGQGIQ